MDIDEEFLIGGDELFHNPRFVDHYEFIINDYIPRYEKPIAFFMSCSKHKPYYKSPYRRVFNSMLEKNLDIRDLSQIYTISEPAILVPEEFDDTLVTKYDFPPDKLGNEGKDIFINRLAIVLPKLIKAHKFIFYILPKHHRSIFETALEITLSNDEQVNHMNSISRIVYAPPLTYNLPKARKIIEETLEKFQI